MYRINISYSTGDSFSNRETESLIDLSWNNLEIAKENLKRIKDHSSWYNEKAKDIYEALDD